MDVFRDKIEKAMGDVEFSDAPASEETLRDVQQKLGFDFGPQLKSYLGEFGYLSRGSSELYGVNERQKLESDLVLISQTLHDYFPMSRGMAAVDNQGDGDYILCDARDMIYEFIPSDRKEIVPLGKDLLGYILERLKS